MTHRDDSVVSENVSAPESMLDRVLFFPTELLCDPDLPTKVWSWRKKRRMTQVDLSRAAGVPQSALSRLENGKTNVSIGLLEAVCRGLKITPLELKEGSTAVIRLEDARHIRASDANRAVMANIPLSISLTE